MAKSGLDCLVEDDAKKMLALVQEVAQEAVSDHLLLDGEFVTLVEFLQVTVTAEWLRRMFQAGASGGGLPASREFACGVFAERCESLLAARLKVVLRGPRIDTLVQRTLRRESGRSRGRRRAAGAGGARRIRAARAAQADQP